MKIGEQQKQEGKKNTEKEMKKKDDIRKYGPTQQPLTNCYEREVRRKTNKHINKWINKNKNEKGK